MDTSIGVNLRVTAHSNQGGRKYMEDMFCVAYQPTADEKDLLYAYFGIFDGHGGREAALYAKTHLMDHIVSQKNFWADDDESVLRAIKEGFISVHHAMWRELDKWPKTQSGLPSTSGTTASVAFVRRGKLYVGHVGDSGIVLGYQDPNSSYWKAKPLTIDHKPESPKEHSRIQKCGGKVISKSGVPRVVWNRPRIGHKGPVRRSTLIDEIPFLAVARSLGDLWSYNSELNEFVVSPVPDTSVYDIDVNTHRCLILGSDGLWNMLSAQDAVNSVYFAEKNNERQHQISAAEGTTSPSGSPKNWINPSKRLVDRALDRWYSNNLRADNTSVVTVVIDPPGPPKAQRQVIIRTTNSPSSLERSLSPVPNSPCAQMNGHPVHAGRSFHRAMAGSRFPEDRASLPRPTNPSSTPNPDSVGTTGTSVRAPGRVPAHNLNKHNAHHETRSRQRNVPSRRKATKVAPTNTCRAYSRNLQNVEPLLHQNRTVAPPESSPSQQQYRAVASGATSSVDDVQIHEISSSSEGGKMDGAETTNSSDKLTRSKQRYSLNLSPVQPTRKRHARQSENEGAEMEESSSPRKVMKLSNKSDKGASLPAFSLEQERDLVSRLRKPNRPVHPSKAKRGEGLKQMKEKETEMKENGKAPQKAVRQTRSARILPQVQEPLCASSSTFHATDNTSDLDKSPSTRQALAGMDVSLSQLASLPSPKVTTKSTDRSPQSPKGEPTVAVHSIPRSGNRPKRTQGLSNKPLKQQNAVSSAKKETPAGLRSGPVRVSRDKQLHAKQNASKRLSAKKHASQRKAKGVPSAKKAVKKGGSEKSIPKMETPEDEGPERNLRSATQSALRVTRSMKK